LVLLLCDLSLVALGSSWTCPQLSISSPITLSQPLVITNLSSVTSNISIIYSNYNIQSSPNITHLISNNTTSTPPSYTISQDLSQTYSINSSNSSSLMLGGFSHGAQVSITCSCSLPHTLRCDGALLGAKKDARTALELIVQRIR
jgi:hypothetical protein